MRKKRRNKKEQTERNWISLSVIILIVNIYLTYFYSKDFSKGLFGFFLFLNVLSIYFLVFFYVLGNLLRETPDIDLKKSILKIKKIEVYESWYFLLILALVFASIVVSSFLMFGVLIGVAVLTLLYGFLLAWIRDILKHKREN